MFIHGKCFHRTGPNSAWQKDYREYRLMLLHWGEVNVNNRGKTVHGIFFFVQRIIPITCFNWQNVRAVLYFVVLQRWELNALSGCSWPSFVAESAHLQEGNGMLSSAGFSDVAVALFLSLAALRLCVWLYKCWNFLRLKGVARSYSGGFPSPVFSDI